MHHNRPSCPASEPLGYAVRRWLQACLGLLEPLFPLSLAVDTSRGTWWIPGLLLDDPEFCGTSFQAIPSGGSCRRPTREETLHCPLTVPASLLKAELVCCRRDGSWMVSPGINGGCPNRLIPSLGDEKGGSVSLDCIEEKKKSLGRQRRTSHAIAPAGRAHRASMQLVGRRIRLEGCISIHRAFSASLNASPTRLLNGSTTSDDRRVTYNGQIQRPSSPVYREAGRPRRLLSAPIQRAVRFPLEE